MRNYISALALMLAACVGQPATAEPDQVVRYADLSEAQIDALEETEKQWEITIYHAPGITGANSVFVPDAFELLDEIVEKCSLGRAYLQFATDGVALLHSSRRLTPDQAACIRTYEQPGLRLMEVAS